MKSSGAPVARKVDRERAVVDALDDLAASGLTARELMVVIDRHPNAKWHEIVARSLYKAIKEMGVKPGVKGSKIQAKPLASETDWRADLQIEARAEDADPFDRRRV